MRDACLYTWQVPSLKQGSEAQGSMPDSHLVPEYPENNTLLQQLLSITEFTVKTAMRY